MMNDAKRESTGVKRGRGRDIDTRRRDRRGRLVAECRYCSCPDGCLCSPDQPCPCGYPKVCDQTGGDQ